MNALVKSLVAQGVLLKKKTGPCNPMTPEERLQRRHQQNVASGIARKNLIRECKDNSLPPPVFTRGRPRKYTDEEALEAKRRQWKAGKLVYTARLKEGMEAMRAPVMSCELARHTT